MRILIVEDDPSLMQGLTLMLGIEGFSTKSTGLGEDGVALATNDEFDLILLDIDLPDMSGHEVIRKLRLAKTATPILVLSGASSMQDKLKAFGFGADDYLTKPFHSDELFARIGAIGRRSRTHSEQVIRCGDLAIRPETGEADLNGKSMNVTAKEYQMLELLATRQGSPVSKDMFLNHLYGGRDEPETKIIDVFICKIRKKLAAASEGPSIETIRGQGYVLRETSACTLVD